MYKRALLLAALATQAAGADPTPVSCCVSGLSYYDASYKLCNLVLSGSQFGVPGGPWQGNAAVDPQTGWPTEDFSVIVLGGTYGLENLAGNYTISGRGTVTAINPVASNAQVTDLQLSDGGFSAVVVVPNTTDEQLILAFIDTQGSVTNLTVLQPGCSAQDVYTPWYVAHVSRCSILRAMDLAATNGNNRSSAAQDIPYDWPNWTGSDNLHNPGAPWSAIVALANAAQRDLWINVPLYATDDYITALATLIHDQLAPGLNLYVEWSNEVWNWAFSQSHWNLAIANSSVTTGGDPFHLNYDNCSNVYYWGYRHVAYQAAVRLPSLFKQVFGAGAVGKDLRVRPVYCSQIAYTFVGQMPLQYLQDVYGAPDTMLHAFCGAPYFSTGSYLNVTANVTAEQILNATALNIADMTPAAGWGGAQGIANYAILGAWYGLHIHGYEGGPDYSGQNAAEQAKGDAQRDPRFTQLYQTYLTDGWYAHGSTESLNHFTAGASNWDEQYGNWGLLEDMRVPVSTKTLAFDAVRAAPTPTNALGWPIPALQAPAGTFAGHNTPPNPVVQYFGVNTTWLYPFSVDPSLITPSGGRLNVTVYTAIDGAPSGQQIEVAVNSGAFRAGLTSVPPGGSVTAGVPCAPVLLDLTAADAWARGLIVVRLRAAVGAGYAITAMDVSYTPANP